MATTPVPQSRPVRLPISAGTLWLAGSVLLALTILFFLGVAQGAVSVFGNDLHIHEFVHDGRHLLGFPCH
jgi:hypothetical protein